MVFDIYKWVYISLLQVFIFKETFAEYCTEKYYSYVLGRYSFRSLYCSSSCCGIYPDEDCCGGDEVWNIGSPAVIAGAVVGGIVSLCLLIGLIVCVVMAVKRPKRQVGAVLHSSSGSGPTIVVGQTLPYQPPPPYTASTIYHGQFATPVQPIIPAYHTTTGMESANPSAPPPPAPPPPQLYPQHF